MTRLALILSGGASLGTYVAGAVAEILRALESDRRDGLRVHVVSGASAGALTAAMVGRALAVNPSLLEWLETVWVDIVDAELLLRADRADRSALLDREPLEELSRALVTAAPASDDRPAKTAGDPLRVGISLANLHGIPYAFRYGFLNAPERFYGGRVHRDWIEFELRPGMEPLDPVWEQLRRATLASAAFPFALPPHAIERQLGDYPGARFPDPAAESVRMWYLDGGLFDNQPIRLAKQLVERFPDHRDADWRYVLVDPYLDDPGTGIVDRGAPPTAPTRLAAQLTAALLGQSATRDWIEAHKVNARLEILEQVVRRLPELSDALRDPGALDLGRAIGELAERVAEMKVAVQRAAAAAGDPVLAYLDGNLRRIEADPRYAAALADAEGRAVRTRLAKLIFVLESAAGLRDKDVMPLYLVAPPEPGALAGDFLGHFGGFFHREWRAHDFRAGRRDARRLLEHHFADLIDYVPDADEAYRVEPVDGSFDALPEASRRRLEAFLRAEAGHVVDRLSPGLVGGLFGWAWKPLVRRWAARRALEGLRQVN